MKLLIHAATWMNLKSVMLSQRNQIIKTVYQVTPFL